ncbi:MAG: hypothetical protein KKA81_14695 [Bacteroidetes bacterium]|nr:hypothetical protein [Bacteroidota bacterium]
MSFLSKIEKGLLPGTYGTTAIASLLICTVSGIILAIPYDVVKPFESIRQMLLTNPAAVFFRNLHYWSAQFFLIFTILHFWDHLYRSTEYRVKTGVWFRLCVSVFFIFFVMLSGFILKGDQDSRQAAMIFRSLFETIPGGRWVAFALLGREDSFQLVYVHHIATATIFIFIITFEHARTIWSKVPEFLAVSGVLIIFSFLFHAPLQTHSGNIVKGPWYFLGLQEILHLTAHPWIVMTALLFLFFVLLFLPRFRKNTSWKMKHALLGLFGFYILLTISGYFFRGPNWSWTWDVKQAYFPFQPVVIIPADYFPEAVQPGKQEGCLLCHMPVSGFSPSHDPSAIGCSSCHLGNPFTPDKQEAHRSMVLIPGNLAQSRQTCGTADCHPDITERMNNNIMTTLSGMVSIDRYVFGESSSLSDSCRITDIGHSPADMHLRNLCAHCHLGNEKTEIGPQTQISRGGGCNACHLNYSHTALQELFAYNSTSKKDTFLMKNHPSLDIHVTGQHCFGCHSRSGRISLNYEGWQETLLQADDISGGGDVIWYKTLEDNRVLKFISEDIHHKAGLECIDCHISYELMGDGTFYLHKEEQLKVACEDCHYSGAPRVVANIDAESQKIMQLRGWESGSWTMLLSKSGYPMVNTRIDADGNSYLILKNSGNILPLSPPAQVCKEGKGHQRLSCSSCHTAWVPQCIGCHNEYDRFADGYDLLENTPITGTWVEYVAKFTAGPPILGVRETGASSGNIDPNREEIVCFTPGMILSIKPMENDGRFTENIFHRLFAPTEAHTTQAVGRDCKGCHLDPLVLGFGSGVLEYIIEDNHGKWNFTPSYADNPYDGLPEDAWTGFLEERKGQSATRYHHRPFSLAEQKRLLLAGSCLHCHAPSSQVMKEALEDFDGTMKRLGKGCVVP